MEFEENQAKGNGDSEALEVDKKLINVDITIPKDLLEDGDEEIDYDQIIAGAKEEGIKDG